MGQIEDNNFKHNKNDNTTFHYYQQEFHTWKSQYYGVIQCFISDVPLMIFNVKTSIE